LQNHLGEVESNCTSLKIRRKLERIELLRLLLFAGLIIFFICFPYSAFSQSPDPLIQKLDSHYYYPSQLGLRSLAARITWLQKDLTASPQKLISHPEVLFSWNIESDVRIFEVDPRRKGLDENRKEEIENFFQNYREVILPRSLGQTLSGYKFIRSQKSPSLITVEYQSLHKQDEVQKYILEIDTKFWRLFKINIQKKSPPYRATSKFKYIKKEGQWLVSETLARFEMGKDSYSEKTSYTYQKTMKFWLPSKINQVFKKGDDVLHNYQFLINDHLIK